MFSNTAERMAAMVPADRDLLEQAFLEELTIMYREVRCMFPAQFDPARVDFVHQRYEGYGAYLQWKLRERPDLPAGAFNPQEVTGIVRLFLHFNS